MDEGHLGDIVCRFTPEGKEAVRRRLVKRSVITRSVLVGIFVLFILRNGLGSVNFPIALAVIVVLGVFLYIGHRGTRRKADALLSSYEITLTPDAITRRQGNTPDYTLQRIQIARIEDTPHALLLRSSEKAQGPMVVFRGIEHFEELLARVGRWTPIQAQSPFAARRNVLLTWAVYLSPTLSVVAAILITKISILLPVGLILLAGLGWSFWALRFSRTVDRSSRRTAWLMALPGAALLLKMWLILR
jgi:hypothetical protein